MPQSHPSASGVTGRGAGGPAADAIDGSCQSPICPDPGGRASAARACSECPWRPASSSAGADVLDTEGTRSRWIGRASNPVGGAMRRRVGSTPISLRHTATPPHRHTATPPHRHTAAAPEAPEARPHRPARPLAASMPCPSGPSWLPPPLLRPSCRRCARVAVPCRQGHVAAARTSGATADITHPDDEDAPAACPSGATGSGSGVFGARASRVASCTRSRVIRFGRSTFLPFACA